MSQPETEYPQPIMPRSTAHLEQEFHRRRYELAAEWLTPTPVVKPYVAPPSLAQLRQVRTFVADHSPGHDAWIDEQHNVVRWTCPAVVLGPDGQPTGEVDIIPCAAANMAEARDELGY